jgi:hypothetical protein
VRNDRTADVYIAAVKPVETLHPSISDLNATSLRIIEMTGHVRTIFILRMIREPGSSFRYLYSSKDLYREMILRNQD